MNKYGAKLIMTSHTAIIEQIMLVEGRARETNVRHWHTKRTSLGNRNGKLASCLRFMKILDIYQKFQPNTSRDYDQIRCRSTVPCLRRTSGYKWVGYAELSMSVVGT